MEQALGASDMATTHDELLLQRLQRRRSVRPLPWRPGRAPPAARARVFDRVVSLVATWASSSCSAVSGGSPCGFVQSLSRRTMAGTDEASTPCSPWSRGGGSRGGSNLQSGGPAALARLEAGLRQYAGEPDACVADFCNGEGRDSGHRIGDFLSYQRNRYG